MSTIHSHQTADSFGLSITQFVEYGWNGIFCEADTLHVISNWSCHRRRRNNEHTFLEVASSSWIPLHSILCSCFAANRANEPCLGGGGWMHTPSTQFETVNTLSQMSRWKHAIISIVLYMTLLPVVRGVNVKRTTIYSLDLWNMDFKWEKIHCWGKKHPGKIRLPVGTGER